MLAQICAGIVCPVIGPTGLEAVNITVRPAEHYGPVKKHQALHIQPGKARPSPGLQIADQAGLFAIARLRDDNDVFGRPFFDFPLARAKFKSLILPHRGDIF